MNIAELYDVFYAALEVLDRLFEFWLTGSFALLIATYFIGEKMNRTMYWLICIGYCLFSAGLAIRYLASGAKLLDMRTQLEAAGGNPTFFKLCWIHCGNHFYVWVDWHTSLSYST